jgi:hypothetical protein
MELPVYYGADGPVFKPQGVGISAFILADFMA